MTNDLELVIAAGLFSLGGVTLGALATTGTQLYLEGKREKRTAERAKLLVAGELLHLQMIFASASEGEHWPPMEDVNASVPTSAWHENKSILLDHVHEDLWNELVMTYAILEAEKGRFLRTNKAPAPLPLPAEQAEELKATYVKLGGLRRQLGGGGGWPDEIKVDVDSKF